MIKFARDLRLIPIVLVAIGCLFLLKVLGLVLDGGYTLSGTQTNREDAQDITGSVPTSRTAATLADPNPPVVAAPSAPRKQSWAQQMFNFPEVTGSVDAPPAGDITGSAATAKDDKAAKPDDGKVKTAEAEVKSKDAKTPSQTTEIKNATGTTVALDNGRLASASERALLERLQERRHELDSRARELDIRENLLKAAEKRLEARVGELKQVENRLTVDGVKKDESETERFKGLVTMYENMKAKDAAKIFDRLDMKVLIEVATKINPRRMSDIMGQMTAEAAERLTVELANRASMADRRPASPETLPKIEGRPPPGT